MRNSLNETLKLTLISFEKAWNRTKEENFNWDTPEFKYTFLLWGKISIVLLLYPQSDDFKKVEAWVEKKLESNQQTLFAWSQIGIVEIIKF